MATTKATDYVIYRYGSNGANQPMTPVMPVGVYTGTGRTADERVASAIEQAQAEHTVYANQYLDARPLVRTSREDQQNAWEHQEAEAALREQYA